jgi:hypothetical protein
LIGSDSSDDRRGALVVEVRENATAALVEHEGQMYVSPPQNRKQALELVAVLLGHPTSVNGGAEQLWRQAIAGGQRSVKMRRVVETVAYSARWLVMLRSIG